MKQRWIMLAVMAFAVVCLMNSPIEANFVQCPPPGPDCDELVGVTDDADIINGTPGQDDMDGRGGGDVMFGNEEADQIEGDEGDDLIFGGPGSDVIRGDDDNDTIVVGTDDDYFSQKIRGRSGNDLSIVFAGDVTTCLFIDMGNGSDIVSLIGFGPYNINQLTEVPFAETSVHLIDPIGGGHIFIEIDPTGSDDDAEFIFGLPTPDPALIDEDTTTLADDCPGIVDGSDFF